MSDALLVMKWPLLACLLLPGVLVYFGLHIVRRGIIFVDLALAQVAALGTCLCVMLGHDPHDFHTYLWSLGFTLIGALIFTFTRTRENHRVPQEALIGIVYVVAAAASILLLSKSTAGNEELKNTLVGDVLNVSQAQVWKTFALFAVIAAVHFVFRKRFLALTFDPMAAAEPRARGWDFLFYATFGLVVTGFVQIGGVLLVFSYLVVPAICANLFATSLGAMLAIGIVAATLGGVGGLALSYQCDLPTGAAIVCSLGVVLVLSAVIAKLRPSRADATKG
ncbi:MAG: metal ABC transporter permease [Pedosphaera sp.]|nr:metal ABC transporter permease [Pedosphaera sp.]